jgi:hypothetical protein
MTILQFSEKYGEYMGEDTTATDVLTRIAANLSDFHLEKAITSPDEFDSKLNLLKQYIFDYKSVLRTLEINKNEQ